MDKLLDNNLFVKFIALFLALLLFITVNTESADKNNGAGGFTSKNNEEVVENVPVTIIYDEENLVVSGVPETVNVTIAGPNAIVQTAKTLRNFEVFVDLTDEQIGEKRVPLQIREISDKLDVTIDPSFAQISIQERVSKEVLVEAEYNNNMIAEGYYAELPEVAPNKVKVTGAKDVIEKISYVKATIDNNGKVDQTITREATVLVLDQKLNKLPVKVEPETVQVTIPVKSLSKVVPINILQKGTLPKGVSIEDIELDVNEVEIIAKQEVLNEIDNIDVELDLSKINRNQELQLPVIVPDDVIKVDRPTVKVTVTVLVEDDVTFTRVPINQTGLADDLKIEFANSDAGLIDIEATGPIDIIRGLKKDDFALTVDVKGLSEGEHLLLIEVVGPDKVRWKLSKENVEVIITQS